MQEWILNCMVNKAPAPSECSNFSRLVIVKEKTPYARLRFSVGSRRIRNQVRGLRLLCGVVRNILGGDTCLHTMGHAAVC